MQSVLACGKHRSLDLAVPQVMGVLNVTPDSFSDGGAFFSKGKIDLDLALSRARTMAAEGAAIIDVGGESTRPGAQSVCVTEELDRVMPVVEAINKQLEVVISVDTSKPEVMLEAQRVGAGMINDVRALRAEGALAAACLTGLPICLMHMQGQPKHMQDKPQYQNVLAEVVAFLSSRIEACQVTGISRDRLLIDPGFGFGKSLAHNLVLMKQLADLQTLGLPVLVGISRKSMIGKVLQNEVGERMVASVALAVLAIERGANIIRTHDVQATMDAIKMTISVLNQT